MAFSRHPQTCGFPPGLSPTFHDFSRPPAPSWTGLRLTQPEFLSPLRCLQFTVHPVTRASLGRHSFKPLRGCLQRVPRASCAHLPGTQRWPRRPAAAQAVWRLPWASKGRLEAPGVPSPPDHRISAHEGHRVPTPGPMPLAAGPPEGSMPPPQTLRCVCRPRAPGVGCGDTSWARLLPCPPLPSPRLPELAFPVINLHSPLYPRAAPGGPACRHWALRAR